MMTYVARQVANIANMPRGGPDASCLDRLLQTDRPEYLDRDDVDEEVKRGVVRSLARMGTLFKENDRIAELVLREVADIPDPRILELGAAHGGLSRTILEQHPTATVTVSDVDPVSVAALAASDLGGNPRAEVRTVDATAIAAPDRSFDLAVFALSFHHLPPEAAARVFAEGTRVADTLLIVDLPRPPSPVHLAKVLSLIAPALVWPFAHDGLISSMRAYSPSALRALAAHADPAIEVEITSGSGLGQFLVAARQTVVARRPR